MNYVVMIGDFGVDGLSGQTQRHENNEYSIDSDGANAKLFPKQTLRVQVPNSHSLSQIVTYKTTIRNPST